VLSIACCIASASLMSSPALSFKGHIEIMSYLLASMIAVASKRQQVALQSRAATLMEISRLWLPLH